MNSPADDMGTRDLMQFLPPRLFPARSQGSPKMTDSKNPDYKVILSELRRMRETELTEDDQALLVESEAIEKLREIAEEISEPRQILFTST